MRHPNSWKNEIKGWYAFTDKERNVVQFCINTPHGFYHTQWTSPHIQKNGNYDRFWLIQQLKKLSRIVRCRGIMGSINPFGTTYEPITQTTGEVKFFRSPLNE